MVRRHRLKQFGINLGELSFQCGHVLMQLAQDEQVAWREIAIERCGQVVAFVLQAATRHSEHLAKRFAFNQPSHHLACGNPFDVGYDGTQFDPAILKHFVHTVGFAREHLRNSAAIAREEAQFTQVFRRNETAPHQPKPRQHSQPFRITHVGLAARHILDEMRIHDQRRNAHPFDMRMRTLPVNARALHHHQLHTQLLQPGRHRLHVALEATKLSLMLADRAIVFFNQHRHDMQHAMHIDTGNSPM